MRISAGAISISAKTCVAKLKHNISQRKYLTGNHYPSQKSTPPASPPLKKQKREGKSSKAAKLPQLHPCAGQEGAKPGPQSRGCCSNAPLPSPPAPMGWGHMDPLQALYISAFMCVVCMSPARVQPRRMLCWTKHSSFESTAWR